MDQKKQNLTPELKQIYDRVMNTQVATKPQDDKDKPQPAVPQAPTSTNQAQQTAQATPAAPGSAPATTNPAPPQADTGFLSSVPPRPVSDNKSFVFTGKKVEQKDKNTETSKANPGKSITGGKKISMPIIGALVLVLVVVWGVFWAKLLGLI